LTKSTKSELHDYTTMGTDRQTDVLCICSDHTVLSVEGFLYSHSGPIGRTHGQLAETMHEIFSRVETAEQRGRLPS